MPHLPPERRKTREMRFCCFERGSVWRRRPRRRMRATPANHHADGVAAASPPSRAGNARELPCEGETPPPHRRRRMRHYQHEVRYNRNRLQVNVYERSVEKDTPPVMAHGARHSKHSASNQMIDGQQSSPISYHKRAGPPHDSSPSIAKRRKNAKNSHFLLDMPDAHIILQDVIT